MEGCEHAQMTCVYKRRRRSLPLLGSVPVRSRPAVPVTRTAASCARPNARKAMPAQQIKFCIASGPLAGWLQALGLTTVALCFPPVPPSGSIGAFNSSLLQPPCPALCLQRRVRCSTAASWCSASCRR